MTRAAWTWMTSCQQRGDCHPCPAGPQSLRCQGPTAKLFCQARVLETGDRVWAGDTQRWGFMSTVICRAGDDFVICGWWCEPRLVTSWQRPLGTMATRPQSSSHHQENNLFVSRHLSGVGCKSELFTTLLLPLPTFTWIEYMETYRVQTTLFQFNAGEELIWIQSLQSYPILSRSSSLDRQAHFLLVSSN